MASLLRQLVEASQLQATAEPWVAGARDHRIWPAGRHFHSVQDAIFAEDRQDKDRLQEGSGGIGVASPQKSLRMYIQSTHGDRRVGRPAEMLEKVHIAVIWLL